MDEERLTVSSEALWEDQVGYSRAVRIGAHVAVAGTPGEPPYARLGSPQEAYRQAKSALEKIDSALKEAGAAREDVIRSRMYVVEIHRDWQAVGKAHREFFGDIKPASTMVQVARLIDKAQLVEIEVDAILVDRSSR